LRFVEDTTSYGGKPGEDKGALREAAKVYLNI
jgi:hypothetical protein